jgi:hypothetical protein
MADNKDYIRLADLWLALKRNTCHGAWSIKYGIWQNDHLYSNYAPYISVGPTYTCRNRTLETDGHKI